MKFQGITVCDFSNGKGVRVSLFVQGCDFHCKGCFNPETWDFNGGREFTQGTLSQLLEACDKPYIKGLSILGGEPLNHVNVQKVGEVITAFKKKFPEKDVWVWTGNVYENIVDNASIRPILEKIDYLVDGQFREELKDLALGYAGSKNQRLIDVKESLKEGRVILSELYNQEIYNDTKRS